VAAHWENKKTKPKTKKEYAENKGHLGGGKNLHSPRETVTKEKHLKRGIEVDKVEEDSLFPQKKNGAERQKKKSVFWNQLTTFPGAGKAEQTQKNSRKRWETRRSA